MRLFKKLCCLFMLLFLPVSCQKTEEQRDLTLIVGLQSGYPPFEYRNTENVIVGFDLDVASYLAQELGKKLVIKDMDFDGEILALNQGKVDLIISGMNMTPSRLKEINMVPYHGEDITSLSLLFWNQIPKEIHSFQDILTMPHVLISVEAGTNSEAFLSKYKEIELKTFQGSLAPLMDVKFGKSLAQLVETDVAEYLMRKHPEIKSLLIPLSPDEVIMGCGIGVHKENEPLFHKVEEVISQMKLSGKLAQLEHKWFDEVSHAN